MSSKGSTAIVVLIVILLILIFGGFYFYKKAHSPSFANPVSFTQSETVNPATQNVTTQNAPAVMDETGAAIEKDMGQLDADMQSLNQNDTSQDNPNNL